MNYVDRWLNLTVFAFREYTLLHQNYVFNTMLEAIC